MKPLDPKQKYYHGELEIRCGEYEFTYHYFVNETSYEKVGQTQLWDGLTMPISLISSEKEKFV